MFKALLISGLAIFFSASAQAGEELPAPDPELKKDRGYFYGYSFGGVLRQAGSTDVDFNELIKGLTDALSGQQTRLDQSQQRAVIEEIQKRQDDIRSEAETAQDQVSHQNLANAVSFLDQNKVRPNIVTTASGLQYEVIVAGEGASPTATDKVKVHYRGTFMDGAEFDSSYKRAEPAVFGLNQVIVGWTEAIQLMKVGGKNKLYIHPELGYGPGGRSGIPPNALLIFEVELLDIVAEMDLEQAIQ